MKEDSNMDEISLKKAHLLTSPLYYVLVTSKDTKNQPNVLGVAWLTRTSWKPYLMLISIDHKRFSHECISYCKEFVINYPTIEQKVAAWYCGTHSGRKMDKIKAAGLKLIDSLKVSVPTIADVKLSLECKVINEYDTGDHTIFIGEVVAARQNPQKKKHLYLHKGDLTEI